MESIPEVKEALAARSQVADLEDLRNEGRKRVKVVRAEQVAEMISDAVRQALSDPRLMTRVEAERLVEAARQAQAGQLAELQAELERVTRERDEAVAGPPAAGAQGGGEAPAAAAGVSPEMMLQMMQQFAAMQGGNAGQQGGGDMGEALSGAIDKLSNTLNERLEKFGRKMGVSGAVETGPVSFDALFKNDDVKLESNVDSIEVKHKKAGGIAANLEKLKKLKGGG